MDNAWMDIDQIRLANLQAVLDHHYRGVKSHLAEDIGVAANNISRYFSANPDHRRTVSKETARAIEKAAGLPNGWMDVPHADGDGIDLNREAEGLPDERLADIQRYIRFLKENPEKRP